MHNQAIAISQHLRLLGCTLGIVACLFMVTIRRSTAQDIMEVTATPTASNDTFTPTMATDTDVGGTMDFGMFFLGDSTFASAAFEFSGSQNATLTVSLDPPFGVSIDDLFFDFSGITFSSPAEITGFALTGVPSCDGCTQNPWTGVSTGFGTNSLTVNAGNLEHDGVTFGSISATFSITVEALASDPEAIVNSVDFDANGLVTPLSGAGSTQGDGDAIPDGSYSWELGGTHTLAGTNQTPTVALSDMVSGGLTSTTGAGSTVAVELTVTDTEQDPDATDTANGTISYVNTGPDTPTLSMTSLTFEGDDSPHALTTGVSDPDDALESGSGLPSTFETFSFSYTLGSSNIAGSEDDADDIGSNLASISVAAAVAAGLTPSNDITLSLNVSDKAGEDGDSNTLTLMYDNSDPSGSLNVGEDGTGTANVSDADLGLAFQSGPTESVHGEVWAVNEDGTDEMLLDSFDTTSAGSVPIDIGQALMDLIDQGKVSLELRLSDAFGGEDLDSQSLIGGLAAVPEPVSIAIWSMLALGVTGYVIRRRRKK